MNVKEKMQLLNEAIQALNQLYKAFDEETPRIIPRVNSELKKIMKIAL